MYANKFVHVLQDYIYTLKIYRNVNNNNNNGLKKVILRFSIYTLLILTKNNNYQIGNKYVNT